MKACRRMRARKVRLRKSKKKVRRQEDRKPLEPRQELKGSDIPEEKLQPEGLPRTVGEEGPLAGRVRLQLNLLKISRRVRIRKKVRVAGEAKPLSAEGKVRENQRRRFL